MSIQSDLQVQVDDKCDQAQESTQVAVIALALSDSTSGGGVSSNLDGDGDQLASKDSKETLSLEDDAQQFGLEDESKRAAIELSGSGGRKRPLDLSSFDRELSSYIDSPGKRSCTESTKVSALDLISTAYGGGESSDSSFDSLVDEDRDSDGNQLASNDSTLSLVEEPQLGQEDESKRAAIEVSDDGGKQQLELHLSPFDQELVALSEVDSPLKHENVQVESKVEEDKVEATEQVADNSVVSGQAGASVDSAEPKEKKEEDEEDETSFENAFHKDSFLEFLYHAH